MEQTSYNHPETLEETPPSFVLLLGNLASYIFVTYGWYLLAVTLILTYYWQKIWIKWEEWYKIKSEKEYDAKCKKDPDWLRSRQSEMEAARKKMQEELDMKAALHAEKLKEKEEQKRAELLSTQQNGGIRLGDRDSASSKPITSSATKKSFRSEYNPLMGSGSSGGYRPAPRSCPGGGCG